MYKSMLCYLYFALLWVDVHRHPSCTSCIICQHLKNYRNLQVIDRYFFPQNGWPSPIKYIDIFVFFFKKGRRVQIIFFSKNRFQIKKKKDLMFRLDYIITSTYTMYRPIWSFYAPLEKGGILFCNCRSVCRSVGL